MRNQKGYMDLEIAGAFFMLLCVVLVIFSVFFVRFRVSNQEVSGIAYNTSNDSLIGGNTHFSVRASESTYVSEENQSSYCLPPDSPYKDLVNRAARDKRIKIVVSAHKYFAIQKPWTCNPSVTVEEVK